MKLAIAIWILTGATVQAATIAAASASRADVQTAVTSASDGDTITIPNGAANWTAGIATTKQIIIRALNYTAVSGGTNSRNVIITNNSADPLFEMVTGSSYHCGVGGISFIESAGGGGHIWMSGTGSKVALVFDCYMQVKPRYSDDPADPPIQWLAQGGVIWNLYADATAYTDIGSVGSFGQGLRIKSDRGWTTASTMGTNDTDGVINLYLEDSTIINCGQWPDVDDQGRYVCRYSTLDGTWGTQHGFTSTWGGRHAEYYNNTFSVTYNSAPYRNMSGRYYWLRAGTIVFTDNTVNTPVNTSEWGAVSQLQAGEGTPVGTYLIDRQPGCGHNGSAYISDPMYAWNETGGRAYTFGLQGSWTSTQIATNRDYYMNNGAKSGYAKYTYPHPARTAVESGGGGGSGNGRAAVISGTIRIY